LFITQYLTIGRRYRLAVSIEFVNYRPDQTVFTSNILELFDIVRYLTIE